MPPGKNLQSPQSDSTPWTLSPTLNLNLKYGTISANSVLIKQLCMNEYHGEILIGKQSVCDKLMSIQALFTSHFECITMDGSSIFFPKNKAFFICNNENVI